MLLQQPEAPVLGSRLAVAPFWLVVGPGFRVAWIFPEDSRREGKSRERAFHRKGIREVRKGILCGLRLHFAVFAVRSSCLSVAKHLTAKENRGNEPFTAKEFAKFAKEFFAAFAFTLPSLRLEALVYPLQSI